MINFDQILKYIMWATIIGKLIMLTIVHFPNLAPNTIGKINYVTNFQSAQQDDKIKFRFHDEAEFRKIPGYIELVATRDAWDKAARELAANITRIQNSIFYLERRIGYMQMRHMI